LNLSAPWGYSRAATAILEEPGFLTTDITDPLNLKFHLLDNNSSQGTSYGPRLTINWAPLTSANSTNQNPA
jgi:hypothetical protein